MKQFGKKTAYPSFGCLVIATLVLTLSVCDHFNSAWAQKPIKVGLFPNKPIVYFDDGPKGLFVEVLNHVAEEENWEIEYVVDDLESCLRRLKRNELDLMTSLGENPERLAFLQFSKEPVWTFWGTVYSSDKTINSILDLRDKRVGVRTHNKTTQALRALLDSFNIQVKYSEFQDYESAFEALEKKTIDALAVNNTYAFSRIKYSTDFHKTDIVFNPFSSYFAVPKNGGDPALLEKIDRHVKLLKADTSSSYYRFVDRWFGNAPTFWTSKRIGFYAALLLFVTIMAMATWRFISVLKVNRSLALSITKRKKTEELLRISEERFKLAMEANRDGVWDWNIETDEVYYSPGYTAMLGYDDGEFPPHVTSWKDFIHPEDREAALKANRDCIENRCDDFEVDFRMQAKDGEWRWIHGRGKTVSRDSSGRATRMVGTQADITDRKTIERTLRESEAYMRSIFRAAPAGIGVVRARAFSQVNDMFCQMLGYDREELIGKNSIIVYPTEEEYARVGVEKYEQINLYGAGTVETVFKRKDGTFINVLLSSTPIDMTDQSAGVTFIALDITSRKAAEDALRTSELKYRTMMEAIKDPVYICSQNYRVQYMNPAMIDRTGYDATGTPCYRALHDFDRPCPWCGHEKMMREGRIEQDVVSPKDQRLFHLSGSVMANEDGTFSKLFIFRDNTEFKQLQDRLQQAQKMEAIGNLAGGIAHDFNNILFPIIGLAEMQVEDLPAGSPEHESAQEILAAGKRGSALVKQILAFSRQVEHSMMPVRINRVVEEALKLCRSTIPSNIDIVSHVKNDCGRVLADPTQLHQIVMNLITNAYHAIGGGNGEIEVTLAATELKHDQQPDFTLKPGRYATLTVSDTGCGIDPALSGKIFEPYFTTKEKGRGTGLGLSIVYGIIKKHRGDVRIVSQVGQGTTFTVYLPLFLGVMDSKIVAMEQDLPTGSGNILLVDDDIPVAQSERQMLERLGYHVSMHTSSTDALEAFRSNPKAFDLVVTDMMMPLMTGDRLVKKLLAIEPGIPILICTGFSEGIDQDHAKAIGARGVLMKPVLRSNLAEMVRKALDG